MNSQNDNPAKSVVDELEQHIRSMKFLLNQLEPSQRLLFVNEMMIKFLTPNKSNDSAQDKLNRKHNKSSNLTNEQAKLCDKLTKTTENIYRANHNDDLF